VKEYQGFVEETTHTNITRLKNAIDKLDGDGSQYGLELGVTFKNPKKEEYYTIVRIDDRK